METDSTISGDDAAEMEYDVGVAVTREQREALFAVRMTVFVEEQSVPPQEEIDHYDAAAAHFYARLRTPLPGDPIGIVAAARLVDRGSGTAKIGRVAVLRGHRGRGVGSLLMRHIHEYARHEGFQLAVLEAQLHAIPFYERLGYVAEGGVFLDAKIEHRLMKLRLAEPPE